ncbi:MAG TPA: hypothetical protein VFZ53_26760 [Polyangiaceae bacterium]
MTRARWFLVAVAAACVACEKDAPRPAASSAPAETPTAVPSKPPEPAAPGLAVDKSGAMIGFERVSLDARDAPQKLRTELERHKRFFEGQDAKLPVERKVKPAWVSMMVEALGAVGAARALVRTETRADFPGEVGFVPLAKAKTAPACSVVMMILEDRGTAVWKLGGGVAGKRGKGMAGPDLTLTGETVERYAKGCSASTVGFVAGAEGVEWGLVFDLAASTRRLPKAYFTDLAVLGEPPVAGRPVALP